jgi:hypothetical protein
MGFLRTHRFGDIQFLGAFLDAQSPCLGGTVVVYERVGLKRTVKLAMNWAAVSVLIFATVVLTLFLLDGRLP